MRFLNIERIFKTLALIFLGILIMGGAQAGNEETGTIKGMARVVDGNVLEVDDVRVRIFGIAAPQPQQTCDWPKERVKCGEMALKAMRHLARNKPIQCEVREVAKLEGVFAICRVDRLDVGAQMVRMGWAIADTRISDRYVRVEKFAKTARRGLWHGEFVKPWEWDPKAPNISGAD